MYVEDCNEDHDGLYILHLVGLVGIEYEVLRGIMCSLTVYP